MDKMKSSPKGGKKDANSRDSPNALDSEPTEKVLLYIDNSNIFINAQIYSGRKMKGYRNSIPDVALRIDVGKLVYKARKGRTIHHGKLYGSEPPALDTVWEAIRRKQVDVKTFARSNWNFKEKEIDGNLIADAVRDIIVEHYETGLPCTVILFSGDRDLLPVVDQALQFGCSIEIWSFRFTTNKKVELKAKANPGRVSINYIEDIFGEITFTKVIWGKRNIPPERSLVATVNIPQDADKKEVFTKFVSKACVVFQVPMMGKYMEDFKYIILVPCFRELRVQKRPKEGGQSDLVEIQNYDFDKHIMPYVHQLMEAFPEMCVKIQPWFEFRNSANANSTSYTPLRNRFEALNIESDKDDDTEVSPNSLPDGADGNNNDDDDEIIDDFYGGEFLDAHHEDVNENFTPVLRKEKKSFRLYSAQCTHKFACRKGLACTYKHTKREQEFFKKEKDPKRRYLYKTKPCYFENCRFKETLYLCPYAHSLEESRCVCCKEKGSGQHWMDKCPLNKFNNTS